VLFCSSVEATVDGIKHRHNTIAIHAIKRLSLFFIVYLPL